MFFEFPEPLPIAIGKLEIEESLFDPDPLESSTSVCGDGVWCMSVVMEEEKEEVVVG